MTGEDSTSFFDSSGREPYAEVMSEYGYVEMSGYVGDPGGSFDTAIPNAYCCANCPYMVDDQRSPTGYWCKKYNFPDRPNGCCDGWEPKSPAPPSEPEPTA
jgi:hypothetical protein